jgi:hypothetical protein
VTPPTAAERREQTREHLRSTIPADAAKAAEAITAAVPRLSMVDLIRGAVLIADLAALADDTDGTEEP